MEENCRIDYENGCCQDAMPRSQGTARFASPKPNKGIPQVEQKDEVHDPQRQEVLVLVRTSFSVEKDYICGNQENDRRKKEQEFRSGTQGKFQYVSMLRSGVKRRR